MADTPTLALIVGTRHVRDADISAQIAAYQTWIDDYVGPVWNVTAKLIFVPYGQKADPTHWWVVLNSRSDISGALGYHSVQPNGLPYARIFADDDKAAGVVLSVTITHEIGEMLVDPSADQTADMGDGRIYARELCDACEDDILAIDIGGVKCSDFVLPSWFDPNGRPPFDHQGRLDAPCPQLAPGGYISFFDGQSWGQVTAMLADGTLSYRSTRSGRGMLRASR